MYYVTFHSLRLYWLTIGMPGKALYFRRLGIWSLRALYWPGILTLALVYDPEQIIPLCCIGFTILKLRMMVVPHHRVVLKIKYAMYGRHLE